MSDIVGIFGIQGSGKTMLMTRYGKNLCESGKDIYSNYHLKGISYTPVVSLNDIDKIKNGVFFS